MRIIIDYRHWDLATSDFFQSTITVNPNKIKEMRKKHNIDFYIFLAHVLSHEYLHHVLDIEHSIVLSQNFDNLTHGKQMIEKVWGYWLA